MYEVNFHDGATLEEVEREGLRLLKDLARDFTKPLISDIQVHDMNDVDCEKLGQEYGVQSERLFDFTYNNMTGIGLGKRDELEYADYVDKINTFKQGYPQGYTVCAVRDAPSFVDSQCNWERPHLCMG